MADLDCFGRPVSTHVSILNTSLALCVYLTLLSATSISFQCREAQKMSCPKCFSGHVNPGIPLGSIKSVYGRRTYVAEPSDGKQSLGVIVIIPDAFVLPFINNQILADHYASAGQYLVYLPDFMDGE
jgi:hypothetical protein